MGAKPRELSLTSTQGVPKPFGPSRLVEAVEDFCGSFRTLAPLADFVVLNVSCPNTTEGKTFEDCGCNARVDGFGFAFEPSPGFR